MARRTVGIRIDLETRSREDISVGSYRYSEDPDFEILLIRYALVYEYDEGPRKMSPVRALDPDPTSEEAKKFREWLADPTFEKHAYNVNFERVCLSRWSGMPTGTYYDPAGWYCTGVQANVHGVFGTLDDVARAVKAVPKDREGKRLIRLFSIPDRKDGRFHGPARCWCGANHSKDWDAFGRYCDQDVVTEAHVSSRFPRVPKKIQREFERDQRVNDRGIRHKKVLAEAAVAQVEAEKDRLMAELKDLTGLDNPNSNQQMRGWLAEQGYPMDSLSKEAREEALLDPLIPEEVERALILKGAASLSSVAKHVAALNTRSEDGRIRGTLQFYGAHTGREAGRGIQPQNLPKYEAPAADRKRLLKGKAGADAPEIAKGTVRSSLIPAKGHVFVVVDENAIEARCLGWLSGEEWVNEEFRGAGKIYEATAATMFGVIKDALVEALSRCGKCGACADCSIRGRGKVSNLALGYAGGAGALVTMGAEREGIDVGNYVLLNREWQASGSDQKFHEWEPDRHDYPELIRLRDLYRASSPATVGFWKLCARAWDVAAIDGKTMRFGDNGVVAMMRDGRHNRLILPSGRSIWYRFARSLVDDETERIDRRVYLGKGKGVGLTRIDTHGGKLTENVTQAVARDVLFDVIKKIEKKTAEGWPARLVLHVHDEVVLEVPKKAADQVLADTIGLMAVPPKWAPGLLVKGEGAIMERYGK